MKYFLYTIIAVIIIINIKIAKAQTVVSTTTAPATVKSADISDGQLRGLMQKGQTSGLTDEQLKQEALKKGMPASEVEKLQNRMNLMRNAQNATAIDAQKNSDARQVVVGDLVKEGAASNVIGNSGLPIFGAQLFNNINLNFEPNLRLPTPQNYIIGPDDQLNINIYGKSLVDWKLFISPEGNINIPGIGLLNVSGKTIEQATAAIKNKLVANNYAIGRGTNVQVSLGNIRSIKVMLVGQVVHPGTYTLSSLSTVFNALYLSGGPTANGSFRQIEVIRNNVIRILDVYDFLLKASQKDNIRLEDGDIVRVPTSKVHVSLAGEVKTPAVYEVLHGETLSDVIKFAGGFDDLAYTATIKVIQLTDQDKKISDIPSADFSNYIPLRGDSYIVDRILDVYENRVSIYGAVIRPGEYELNRGLTLTGLIKKAAGLKPDVFSSHGHITRLKQDNTTELISFDIKAILNGIRPNIFLKKNDVVNIISIFDLQDEYTVAINGDVRNGGTFLYADSMAVQDLIIKAGGFTDGASHKSIEIARPLRDSDNNVFTPTIAQIYHVDLDRSFNSIGKKFILQPFDMVTVRNNTGHSEQIPVKIEGEVLHPGYYSLTNKSEKVSDLVKRAGGLTPLAYQQGASLKRVGAENGTGKNQIDYTDNNKTKLINLQRLQANLKDSTNVAQEISINNNVGINLIEILKHPGGKNDVILKAGDVLKIPQELQTVKINGEILYPVTVLYSDGESFNYYISQAGGYTQKALRHSSYVVYANGAVDNVRRFLFFTHYPIIQPGSEIFVPRKSEVKRTSALEFVSISTAAASLGAIILGILKL
ncbi:MAG: SLBB domain-containing protein [Mucilaginibacter sp.]